MNWLDSMFRTCSLTIEKLFRGCNCLYKITPKMIPWHFSPQTLNHWKISIPFTGCYYLYHTYTKRYKILTSTLLYQQTLCCMIWGYMTKSLGQNFLDKDPFSKIPCTTIPRGLARRDETRRESCFYRLISVKTNGSLVSSRPVSRYISLISSRLFSPFFFSNAWIFLIVLPQVLTV